MYERLGHKHDVDVRNGTCESMSGEDLPPAGQYVQVRRRSHEGVTEHEGMVIESQHAEQLTIRLVNGYHLVVDTKELDSWEFIDEVDSSRQFSSPNRPEINHDLPSVRLIHTGGTIASQVDYESGAVQARYSAEELLDSVPQIAEIANLSTDQLFNKWSDDLRPKDWNAIIQATKRAFDEGARGVVIAHGTDTMHMSAAAVAFAWCGKGGRPPGPIVFTGSQRSSDRGSSDAFVNLRAAIEWAAKGPEPTGEGDGTVIIMHNSLDGGKVAVISGLSARKMHTSARAAFSSIGRETLTNHDLHASEWNMPEPETSHRPITDEPDYFLTDLRILQSMAGPFLLAEHLSQPEEVDALIIHGTGLGHLPLDVIEAEGMNGDIARKLASYKEAEVPVFVVQQCIRGPINLDVYSKGRMMQELGVGPARTTMAPDTAIVKVAYILGHKELTGGLHAAYQENLAGEMTQALHTLEGW